VTVSAAAIVCIRNEEIHLRRCLTHLIDEGIEVYLIDNGSTDGSRGIAEEFRGRGLIGIEDLPWHGAFSLADQLRAKQKVIERLKHDWVIHNDVDEWLCSPLQGQSLLQGIQAADTEGYNYINFHEIVFVPLQQENFYTPDYFRRMSTYYFFQPNYPRLNRARKRSANLDDFRSGGHRLAGADLRKFPLDFYLRHYMILSERHAREKYLGRVYAPEDCSMNWHATRRMIRPGQLVVKEVPELRHLSDPVVHAFDLSAPVKRHFWFW
jgi:glycosyltransferase involved in cell wall biosynthesis